MAMSVKSRNRASRFIHLNDTAKPGIVCGPFHAISYYIGCPYRCSYCYLQATFRGKVEPVFYTNREKALREVDEWLAQPGRLRLNAGELADSLALDGAIPLVDDLVPRFAAQKRHKLLLVTKSTNIRNLLKHDPKGQVIVAFSVSCEPAWRKFEEGTPHPLKRAAAAARVKHAGYWVTLRLDPMLPIPSWRRSYPSIIRRIYERVRPNQWTIGSLRWFPSLPMWTRKVGRSTEVYNFGGKRAKEDGRYRLRDEVRAEMYRAVLGEIKSHDPKVICCLCKETRTMHRMVGLPANGCCYSKALPVAAGH